MHFLPLIPFVSLLALSVDAATLNKRATVLADGSAMKSGKLNTAWSWQSSGKLVAGCPSGSHITSCYAASLTATGMLATRSLQTLDESDADDSNFAAIESDLSEDELSEYRQEALEDYHAFAAYDDASSQDEKNSLAERAAPPSTGRQRIEIYSMPAANKTGNYVWKSFLTKETQAGATFFHLFQLLPRNPGGGPTIFGDIKNGEYQLMDTVNGKKIVVPLSAISAKTITHRLNVTFGTHGALNYTVSDYYNKPIMSYAAKGSMGTQASVKFGLYRNLPSAGAASGYYGDFKHTST